MKKDSRRGKKFWFGLMLLSISAVCTPLSSETRYVSKTGSNTPPYTTPETAATTIQAALDRSFLGDMVLVGPGDYEESITLMQEGIALIGAGRDCCRILVPEGEDSVGIVGESRVVELRGLAVIGGETGIFMFGGNYHMLIADCLVEGAGQCGLLIQGWVDISVLDTVFRGVPNGIHVIRDDDSWAEVGLRVSGCEFVDTVDGIHVDSECTTEVTECSFLRYRYGMYDTWGAATLADSCTFLEGRCGVSAMTMAGVLRVSDCVFAFNTWEAIETDQRGLVTDSLFYANECAYNEWDGGDELDFVGCTFASNRTALGLIPRVTRDCVFWENGEDVPYTYDSLWPETWVLEHCFINDPRFVGRDGNVSGNPEFVGWGAFNNKDNPMHVESSAPAGGDGSAEHPFSSLHEALTIFDFRLREGSPCLGGGAFGGDIGCPSGTAPLGTPRSDTVAIEVVPGEYEQRSLVIPPHITIYAKAGSPKNPCILAKEVHVAEGSSLSSIDFQGEAVYAYGASFYDCEFRSRLCIYGGSATRCEVLGAGTYVGYGSTAVKFLNCLLTASGDSPGVGIPYPQEPHELVNCTVVAPYAMGVSQYPPAICAKLTNCIVAGLVSSPTDLIEARHCLFSAPWPGEGNLAGDPMFVDAEKWDFRLKPESPCVDSGSLSAVLKPEVSVSRQEARLSWSPGLDLDGNPRISGPGVDMGAYEYQSTAANFAVESSSDLDIWQEAGTTTDSEWIDVFGPEIKRKFYRISTTP